MNFHRPLTILPNKTRAVQRKELQVLRLSACFGQDSSDLSRKRLLHASQGIYRA